MDDTYLRWQRDEFMVRLRIAMKDPLAVRWSDGTLHTPVTGGPVAIRLRFEPSDATPPPVEVLRAIAEDRFADAYVAVERPAGAPPEVVVRVDLPAMIGWFLSRAEETASDKRDVHGRFPFEESLLSRRGLHMQPVVDLAVEQLADVLLAEAEASGSPLTRVSPWPDGKRYAVVLTHDVDHIANRPAQLALRKLAGGMLRLARGKWADALWRWREMAGALRTALGIRSTSRPVERIAALERRYGVRSTFFIMSLARAVVPEAGRPAQHYTVDEVRAALRLIREDGHEIGLHGAYDATSAEELEDQRNRLARAVGQPIGGHRHHFLRCRVPEQLRSYEQAGFDYDTSLGWSNDAGVRAGTLVPFVPYDLGRDRPVGLYELGVHLMDTALSSQRSAAAHLDRFEQLRAAARRTCGLFVILYHPVETEPFQSHVCREAYVGILDRLRADPEAHVAPAFEALNTWQAAVSCCRRNAVIQAETDSR